MKDLLNIQLMPNDKPECCSIWDNYPLAYAYVPYQKYTGVYNMEKALEKGTAFPALDKPFGVYGNEFYKGEGEKKLW